MIERNFTPPEIQIKTESKAIDEKWYRELEKIPSTELFSWFGVDKDDTENITARTNLKEKFFAAIKNNDANFFVSDDFKIRYPKIESKNIEFFEDNIKSLQALKNKISLNESNETIKNLYKAKIDEKIFELNALLAVRNNDQEKFSNYSEKIYSRPSKDFFDQSRNELLDRIKTYQNSQNDELRSITSELKNQLSNNLVESETFKIPNFVFETQDLENIAQKTAEYASYTLGNAPFLNSKEIYKATAIKSVFDTELKKIGAINSTEKTWKTSINKSAQSLSVNQEKREITIPAENILNYKELASLVAHEIDTHTKRGFSGENSKLKLLRFGLASYERAEEGVATYNEQKVTGSKELQRLEYYLAVGFAKGLDGIPKNFKELFDIIKNVYFFDNIKNTEIENKSPEEQTKIINSITKKSQNQAYELCCRTFRGTDFNNKQGYCFTKDIVYREGNIGVWQLIQTKKDQYSPSNLKKYIRTFKLGKWDPMNDNQYYLLTQEKLLNN